MLSPKLELQQLKPQLQSVLKRAGIYNRLKASAVYDLYWRLADKSLIENRQKEVKFYRNLLVGFQPEDLIFDIGANEGAKTDIFLRLGARVVAVEPDDLNQKVLRERYLMYRMVRKPVAIVGKAVSDRITVETMYVEEPGSGKNTLSRKWIDTLRGDEKRFGHAFNFASQKEITTATVGELIKIYGLPIFIKIDVEGYEVNVLRGMQCPVPYVSFEVNLPEFRSEGLQCVEVLRKLADGEFNYTTDCRQGQLREKWVGAEEFLYVLSHCTEPSIEVFWKSGGAQKGK